MKTRETGNVYPLWDVISYGLPDSKAVFDGYEDSGYDPNGSDLIVAPYSERLAYALEMQHRAGERNDPVGDGMMAEATRLLRDLEYEAQVAADELKERFNALSEQDKLYAQAVQDWTLDEVKQRIEARGGQDYDQADERASLELIDILDKLVDELKEDGEDEKLVTLATTWREEIAAELTVHSVRDAYRPRTRDDYDIAA